MMLQSIRRQAEGCVAGGVPLGNSIVYRNHKVCDGLASLYDGVPSYIVLLK